MNLNQLFILLMTISILTSCRRGYKIENGKVFYESWNEGNGHNVFLIDSADAKTFEQIEFDCNCDFKFGKDKNHLFIDGEPMRNIDPITFRFIGNYIFRDKDSAYFFGFYTTINDCAIKGINPDNLKLITYPWARADNILIHGFDTLSLDDIDEFKPIDNDWGKTKKYVINGIINQVEILKSADPETFQIINSFSGKDKQHTYEFGKIKN
jgi:DKNYY family